jgi:hypothetical protein
VHPLVAAKLISVRSSARRLPYPSVHALCRLVSGHCPVLATYHRPTRPSSPRRPAGMADAFSPPSPPPAPAPSPSPIAADDLADARLAPWTTSFSPWPAPREDHASGGGRASPLFTILPVSALAIGLVLLVAVAVILAVTRRARPRQADASGSCSGDGKPGAPPSSCGSHNTRCGYAAAGKCYSTTEFAVCPAVAILGSIFSHDWIVFFFSFAGHARQAQGAYTPAVSWGSRLRSRGAVARRCSRTGSWSAPRTGSASATWWGGAPPARSSAAGSPTAPPPPSSG